MASGGTPNGSGGSRRASGPTGDSAPAGGGSGGTVNGGGVVNGGSGGGAGVGSAGAGGRRFSFNIASDFVEARVIEDQIIGEVTARGYGDNDLFAIKLALEEAVINAIKHGNKLDPHKRVWVEAMVGNDEIDILIRDQGPGFKREEVPDPTAMENLEKNSGRGILLIEAYMTQAEWSDSGRQLHMRKTRENALVPKS